MREPTEHAPKLREDLAEEVKTPNAHYNEKALGELPIPNAMIKETFGLHGAAPGSLPREIPEGGQHFQDGFKAKLASQPNSDSIFTLWDWS
ncbi:hypothetical protein P175DRAFT_0534149 [Aspergillus ochraceoroseus IBT 24754]|uniref:Uncharacterized protein n=1 Tax=Aspergillus ochraceoroseus IBT 24754 TaxID=1392256 RepID=A0A2T5LTT4_9EURO|nr:uncharacterized protein P175DRAFT_0534149 [Aspergillus ochraceoroseus IBT 24754]PTU19694.1 hypothetical protein P175DRAFT_0534149 [Aspergillus ochraceoroseus IBT 24754]